MVNEVKYRDIERFLSNAGWTVTRQTGSHIMWTSPDGKQRLSIPPHKGKVSPGVVRQIMKTLPDTPDNWR
jgi:predicted RNA binding protein YcfA (HicA-like mRNA interferase family)